ncbi:DUF2066 domain-containing protein [Legionella yabuuchiae]|uniref:DUF2066 domain-containing protein n=1 Tax=Legionella yabuuchiae TaxID=376727 RepID=UPI0013EFBAC9|nr:DUF2066 domain-containing protein [Legionella yabuuchiae]
MKFTLIWIALTFSTFSLAASSWVYEIQLKLPITNKKQAFHNALQQVVDRLTPGPNDHENPIINSANPMEYIEAIDKTAGTLNLRFKPRAIDSLMIKAGQQPWIVNHPKIKTWVCRFFKRELTCLYPKNEPDIFAVLLKAAQEKGLNLEFQTEPSEREFKITELNLMDIEAFIAKTNMQKSDAVLLLKLYPSTSGQDDMEDWRLYYHGTTSPYLSQLLQRPPRELGKPSFAGVSQFLFEQGEEVEKPTHAVDIRIGNIQTAKAYHYVASYLKQIPGVKHTRLNSVTEDAVLYTLDIIIPTELLEMRLAQKFTSLPSPDGDEGIINFRLKT